jgi:hypothetical protein
MMCAIANQSRFTVVPFFPPHTILQVMRWNEHTFPILFMCKNNQGDGRHSTQMECALMQADACAAAQTRG